MKYKDLTGQRFGRFVALYHAELDKNYYMTWVCRCDCGNLKTVSSKYLLNGASRSCGCLGHEKRVAAFTTHGYRKTRLNSIWRSMNKRCRDKKNKYYGGRGITVCDEWQAFVNFREWALNNGYADDLTIDRIDPNGNYCPENCRWATIFEQNNNTRAVLHLTLNEETHTTAEWAKIANIPRHIIIQRLYSGWDIKRTLTQPKKHCVSKKG